MATTTSTTSATSSLSSATASALNSTPEAIAKANKANAQKILSSLGAGSGVDTAALAQNLVDAEQTPQKNAINAKIIKNENKVSGYAAISFVLGQLKDKFDVLKVKSDFNTMTVTSSDNNAFSIQPGAYASKGSYDLEVLRTAKPQRTLSSSYSSSTDPLNAGNPFNLSLSMGGGTATSIPILASNATPYGLVSAINSANLPVKAQLINSGTTVSAVPSNVTFTGPSFGDAPSLTDFTNLSINLDGKAINVNNLNLPSADISGLAYALQAKLRSADGNTQNLTVSVVNGTDLQISDALGRTVTSPVLTADTANGANAGTTPSINNGSPAINAFKIMLTGPVGSTNSFTMSSPIEGLSFSTNNQTASDASIKVDGLSYTRSTNTITDLIPGSTITLKGPTNGAAMVSMDRDTTSLKTRLTDMVAAWNDANTILKAVSDPKSTLDVYGASLVGDSSVRQIQQQLRNMVLGTPSSPAPNASGLWQLGISIAQTGEITIDNTKLDNALGNNYEDVVTLFTNNKNLFLSSTTDAAGVGGDAVKKLTALLGANGPMLQQTQTANTQNTKYKDNLTKLQTRMDALLKRYNTQFAAMQSLVGQVNSQKTSLKSTFDGMMSTYTNK